MNIEEVFDRLQSVVVCTRQLADEQVVISRIGKDLEDINFKNNRCCDCPHVWLNEETQCKLYDVVQLIRFGHKLRVQKLVKTGWVKQEDVEALLIYYQDDKTTRYHWFHEEPSSNRKN